MARWPVLAVGLAVVGACRAPADGNQATLLTTVENEPWRVVAVTPFAEAPTFNLSVDDTATYFVGELRALAHNTSPCDPSRASLGLGMTPDEIAEFGERHRLYAESRGLRRLDPDYYFPHVLQEAELLDLYTLRDESGTILAAASINRAELGHVHGFASAVPGAGSALLTALETALDHSLFVSPAEQALDWWGHQASRRGLRYDASTSQFEFPPRR